MTASVHRLRDHPAYIRFWSARVLSSLAFQINAVAVGWQVYGRTGSTFDLGMVGLAQFLPMVLLTLPAGHFADRHDRRLILRICQSVEGLTAAFLAFGSYAGWSGTSWIYLAVILLGATRAFESPTMSAMLPGLIHPALLSQATALSASANQTATILGPALGGLLYAAGAGVPYLLAGCCFGVAAILSGTIRLEWAPPPRIPATWTSVLLGLRFIWHRPALLGSVSLDLFAVLLGGATALLPVYARDILMTGPWGLGLLRSAPAIGALSMSFLLARARMQRRTGARMFAAVIVFGLATIVFAFSTSLILSIAALIVLGAADNVSVVIRMSLVQMATPDEMRGRVSAVNALFVGTSNQLGEFESGVTAALIGAVPAVAAGGIGTVIVALLWMKLFPALRDVQSLESVV